MLEITILEESAEESVPHSASSFSLSSFGVKVCVSRPNMSHRSLKSSMTLSSSCESRRPVAARRTKPASPAGGPLRDPRGLLRLFDCCPTQLVGCWDGPCIKRIFRSNSLIRNRGSCIGPLHAGCYCDPTHRRGHHRGDAQ